MDRTAEVLIGDLMNKGHFLLELQVERITIFRPEISTGIGIPSRVTFK